MNIKSIKRDIRKTRFARNMRHNKKMRTAVVAAVLAILAIIAFLIYKDISGRSIYEVSSDTDEHSYTVQYQGKEYEYNESISNILLIGIDSTGEMKTSNKYGVDARADNIDLISFNERDKTIKILPISRDTMTEITKFSAQGYETGSSTDHLGFAFSEGNGGKASSMNVCNAVSDLLYGVEVYKYVTTNIDSIAYANQLIGGVTVTVPNNDLVGKYPEMTEGAEVELTDDNVADFLRYRDKSVDGSNNGRMERQQAFLEAYVEKLETMSKDDYIDMWNQLDDDKSEISTNLTKSMFLNLIGNIKEYKYDPDKDNLSIEGENAKEDGYDVFYPDTDKLKTLVVENFFDKI